MSTEPCLHDRNSAEFRGLFATTEVVLPYALQMCVNFYETLGSSSSSSSCDDGNGRARRRKRRTAGESFVSGYVSDYVEKPNRLENAVIWYLYHSFEECDRNYRGTLREMADYLKNRDLTFPNGDDVESRALVLKRTAATFDDFVLKPSVSSSSSFPFSFRNRDRGRRRRRDDRCFSWPDLIAYLSVMAMLLTDTEGSSPTGLPPQHAEDSLDADEEDLRGRELQSRRRNMQYVFAKVAMNATSAFVADGLLESMSSRRNRGWKGLLDFYRDRAESGLDYRNWFEGKITGSRKKKRPRTFPKWGFRM